MEGIQLNKELIIIPGTFYKKNSNYNKRMLIINYLSISLVERTLWLSGRS